MGKKTEQEKQEEFSRFFDGLVAKGSADDDDLRRLSEMLDEDMTGSGDGLMRFCVSADNLFYEDKAMCFKEEAEVAFEKLLEWKVDRPQLDCVTVTSWETVGEGEQLSEMVVTQDGIYQFAYSEFWPIEGKLFRIGEDR